MCAYVDYTAYCLTRQRKVRPGLRGSDYRVSNSRYGVRSNNCSEYRVSNSRYGVRSNNCSEYRVSNSRYGVRSNDFSRLGRATSD